LYIKLISKRHNMLTSILRFTKIQRSENREQINWFKSKNVWTKIMYPASRGVSRLCVNKKKSVESLDEQRGVGRATLSASTMELLISSRLGNSARTLVKHSLAMLPAGTSSNDSATPVRSYARAK
jgi:hypothetical protein